jgi:hypothetical protein
MDGRARNGERTLQWRVQRPLIGVSKVGWFAFGFAFGFLNFFLNKKWVQGGFTHLLLHQEKGGCVFGVFGFEMHF